MTIEELCAKWTKEAADWRRSNRGRSITADAYEACVNDLRALGDGWVKVSERLPAPCTRVLTFSPETESFHAWVTQAFADSLPNDVTHWRPLHDPPKEKV